MNWLYPQGKKGLTIEVLIKLILALLIAVFILLVITGNFSLLITFFTDPAQGVSDAYDIFMEEPLTAKQRIERTQTRDEFMQFYNGFLQHLDACLEAKNTPCLCTFKGHTLFPENYILKMMKLKSATYTTDALELDPTTESPYTRLRDPWVHNKPAAFGLCKEEGKMTNAGLDGLKIFVKTGMLYVQANGARYLLGKDSLSVHIMDQRTFCLLPTNVQPPLQKTSTGEITKNPLSSCVVPNP